MGCSVDCANQPDAIEANEDIAGIGVLISFLLSAFIVLIVITIYYIFIYDPDLDPFRKRHTQDLSQWPNSIDRAFLYTTRKALLSVCQILRIPVASMARGLSKESLENSMNSSARAISDIQIFTGIALLVSAFQAYTCSLQSYHWQLILYMSWLGLITHAAVLSFLRNHLINHPKQLWWRFGGMFAVLVMFIACISLTADFTWDESGEPSNYAKCKTKGSTSQPSDSSFEPYDNTLETKVKLAFFVTYGYTIRLLKLVPNLDNTPRRASAWLRERANRLEHEFGDEPAWDPYAGIKHARHILITPLQITACRFLHMHIDLLTSFLAEVFWVVLSFSWAARRLLFLRLRFAPKEEDEWAFGQIVPLVLLAVPVAALVDQWPERTSNSEAPANFITLSSDHNFSSTACTLSKYASSTLFRVGGIFVAVPYVHLGIVMLVRDEASLADIFRYFSVAALFVYPTFQATWLFYTLWISKLKIPPAYRRAAVLVIFWYIALSIAAESATLALPKNWDSMSATAGVHDVVAPIVSLGTFVVFSGWFALDSNLGNTADDGTGSYKRIVWALIAGLVVFTSIFGYGWPSFGPMFGLCVVVAAVLQVLIAALEGNIERLPSERRLWVRGGLQTIIIVAAALLMAWVDVWIVAFAWLAPCFAWPILNVLGKALKTAPTAKVAQYQADAAQVE